MDNRPRAYFKNNLIETNATGLSPLFAHMAADLGAVAELRIHDFRCNFLDSQCTILSLKSKRAVVSYKSSAVTLRGHVLITAANRATLESNCVTWDINNQRFVASGGYVLTRGKSRTSGRNICVDAELNVIGKQYAKSTKGEEDPWYGQM